MLAILQREIRIVYPHYTLLLSHCNTSKNTGHIHYTRKDIFLFCKTDSPTMNRPFSIGLSIGLDRVANMDISDFEIDAIMTPNAKLSKRTTPSAFDEIVDKTATPSLLFVKSVIHLFGEKPNLYNDNDNDMSDLENEATKTLDLNETPRLVNSSALPEWYGYYKNVTDGYRLNYTHCQALWSIFEWHSETVNIWTELVPLIILYGLSFWQLGGDMALHPHVYMCECTVWVV